MLRVINEKSSVELCRAIIVPIRTRSFNQSWVETCSAIFRSIHTLIIALLTDVIKDWEDSKMPFYLKEKDIVFQTDGLQSLLIVPCGFCPAASLSVREKKPYIELFRKFLRTEVYDSFIEELRRRLEERGIKTDVFGIRLPHHFVACMWTSGRRQKLAKRAAGFDGVLVLGCDSVVENVRNHMRSDDCRVIQGMEAEGIMNVIPEVSFPFNISLVVQGITSVKEKTSSELRETINALTSSFQHEAPEALMLKRQSSV